MKTLKLLALLLCLCLFPACVSSAEGEVTLTIGDQTFSAPANATELDLGDLKLPDTNEAYAALEKFIQQLPSLTKLDMFSTDIPVKRVLYLGEKYSQIKFGWTILIPCKNDLRKDRPPHRLRTDQTAFSTQHNISCISHGQDVWEVLKYCPDLMALDQGHNNTIVDLSFLNYCPKLRVLIISFNISMKQKKPYLDITPIGNLKDLEYLEICKSNVGDLTPLANCTKLVDLNISTNYIKDLTPLDGLKNLRRLYLWSCDSLRKPFDKEKVRALQEQIPDCEINNIHMNCGGQWRHHSHYDTLFSMFSYQNLEKPQAYEPFDDVSWD